MALALGLFGVADFLRSVNRMKFVGSETKVRLRDMRPSRAELKQAFLPMLRGTLIGTLFGAMPGTGPTITTFIAYAFERKISKTPERFGHGAIEGVARPGGGLALQDAGRFHSDDEPRHPRRPGDGADAGRVDDPGDRSRARS